MLSGLFRTMILALSFPRSANNFASRCEDKPVFDSKRNLAWNTGKSTARSFQGKCLVLHLRWDCTGAETNWVEGNPAEVDLRVLFNSRLSMTQQHALAAKRANCILGCIKHCQSKEVMLPLYLALAWPHFKYSVKSGNQEKSFKLDQMSLKDYLPT